MSDDKREEPAYIGRCGQCRRIVFVAVDTPEAKRDNAKEIAKLIRGGYTVDRDTVGYVRDRAVSEWGCECPKLPKKARRESARV